MKGSVSDKMLLLQKIKKGARKESEKRAATTKKNNRVLITVTVIGSAGPIRFIVNEDDRVSLVIGCTLKSYALEGRLPVLGSDPTHFLLYCSADCKAMSPTEAIGLRGGRSFVLCRQEIIQPQLADKGAEMSTAHKANTSTAGSWKAWLRKSFSFISKRCPIPLTSTKIFLKNKKIYSPGSQ